MDQLTEKYGLNKNKLNSLFKELYHETPYQFFKNKRLSKIKDILTQKTESLTSIAYDYGYTDVNHLSREFKNKFGLSPTAYIENK